MQFSGWSLRKFTTFRILCQVSHSTSVSSARWPGWPSVSSWFMWIPGALSLDSELSISGSNYYWRTDIGLISILLDVFCWSWPWRVILSPNAFHDCSRTLGQYLNGVIHPDFKSARIALVWLDSDEQWHRIRRKPHYGKEDRPYGLSSFVFYYSVIKQIHWNSGATIASISRRLPSPTSDQIWSQWSLRWSSLISRVVSDSRSSTEILVTWELVSGCDKWGFWSGKNAGITLKYNRWHLACPIWKAWISDIRLNGIWTKFIQMNLEKPKSTWRGKIGNLKWNALTSILCSGSLRTIVSFPVCMAAMRVLW